MRSEVQHKREIQRLYEGLAAFHDHAPAGPWAEGYRAEEQFVLPLLQPPGRLLDLGSGTGRYLERLRTSGLELVAADLVLPMLLTAREKLRSWSPRPRAEFCVAEATGLPFMTGSMDYVLSMGCLDLLPSRGQLLGCLREMRRVTALRGKVICSGVMAAGEMVSASVQADLRVDTVAGFLPDGRRVDPFSTASELVVLVARPA